MSSGDTYLEVNDLIEHGEVDVAFVCTSAYVEGHDTFGMELLVCAAESTARRPITPYLIVPTSSSAQSMSDLRGKVFAFTDPISLSGRMYPNLSCACNLASRSEEFFARTFFTYSHDEAIRAVASGVADGAAVDSACVRIMLWRAIHRSQKKSKLSIARLILGIPPVVVSPFTRPQVKDGIANAPA
ncbi:MAG: PhnD/SsuA/transferrin family substrate-binding protein [Chromatiales bacterium]|nr:PhnD/SsuA/transferrin family substrate-binding protein [Chromatiales bacterium]